MKMKTVYPERESMPTTRSRRISEVASDFTDLKHHLRETRINRVMSQTQW